MKVTVRIPSNVPINKAPWDSHAQALADLVRPGATPKVEITLSAKESHRD